MKWRHTSTKDELLCLPFVFRRYSLVRAAILTGSPFQEWLGYLKEGCTWDLDNIILDGG